MSSFEKFKEKWPSKETFLVLCPEKNKLCKHEHVLKVCDKYGIKTMKD